MRVEENFMVGNPSGLDEGVADSFVVRLQSVPSTTTILRSDGAGVSWDTVQKDVLVLPEIALALAELRIEYGDWVEVAAEGEGDAPQTVVDEIKRALDDLPPSQLEMLGWEALGETTFVRFTPPSRRGTSMDHVTGEIHPGVSVFPGRLLEEELYEIDITRVGLIGRDSLDFLLGNTMPAYFLMGSVVGFCPGDAPLLDVKRFWPVPRSVDLTVTPVMNQATNRRMADLAKRWNESPYVGHRVPAVRRRNQALTAPLCVPAAVPTVASGAAKPPCFYPPAVQEKLKEWGYL